MDLITTTPFLMNWRKGKLPEIYIKIHRFNAKLPNFFTVFNIFLMNKKYKISGNLYYL